MSKALYAVGFMAMCAIVLVIHESTDHEQTKLNGDPFLASVEARVVAVAQHRLKKRLADDAAERHVSEARKAIKASLLDADADNQLNVQKYRAKQIILEEGATKKAAPKKAADSNKAPGVKQYTWAQMQEGADAAAATAKKADEDTHSLMKGLLAAPKVDPDSVDTEGANMVTADITEEETEEAPKKAAAKKVVQKVAAVAEDAVDEEEAPDQEETVADEDEETEEAQPAEEKSTPKEAAPTEAAVEEEAEEDTEEEAQPAEEAAPAKKAAPKKVAKKAAAAPKKEAKAEKPAAAKKATAPKKEVKKAKATEVKPTVPEEEEDQEPVADGYNPDENPYANYDEDDNDGDFSY
jgi:hypothetical protein